jgi:diguanylate cyclase (GGDEF)-like protein
MKGSRTMLPSEIAMSAAGAPRPGHKRGYILIAVPNVSRAEAWREIAAESGYDVVVVRDGDEARQQIATHGLPVLLISALSLPKVDGFALLRYLRSQPAGDHTAVIVVSAHQPFRDMARELSESLRITRILPFDVDQPALRDAIDAALRARAGSEMAPGRQAPIRSGGTMAVQPNKPVAEVIGRAAVDAALRFRTSASAVYLCIQGREQLTVFFTSDDPLAGNVQPDDWLFVREVAACTEPMVIPNLAEHPLFASRPSGNARIVGLVGVPIFPSAQRLAGALCLINRQSLMLDAAEIDELAKYAEGLGKELEASLTLAADGAEETPDVQTLEQQAITDSLTGLFNRRGVEKSMANEVSRARRLGTSLSCILLDVDSFKAVNDTLGHQAGDQVLREISRLLKKTVRAYDTVGRWGGDEFLMLLPGVELEQAQRLAERVRAAVEARKIDGVGGTTISAGVATLGSDYNFDGTLRAADQRLYQAKQAGRNRIS